MLLAMVDGWIESALDGVLRRNLSSQADLRGSFSELWRQSWTAPLGLSFAQANVSRSAKGVLRGLHFHLRQSDLWVVLDGRAHVVLADLRPMLDGATEKPAISAEVLTAGEAVLIPPGVAHGFWALDKMILLYLVSEEYDGTDELGFAWNDPQTAALWPSGNPLLSARDAEAPPLTAAVDLARPIRQRGQSTAR